MRNKLIWLFIIFEWILVLILAVVGVYQVRIGVESAFKVCLYLFVSVVLVSFCTYIMKRG